jgi:DNA polymerase
MQPLADIYEAYRSAEEFDHFRTPEIVMVPGEGSPRPSIFITGEAPGAMENTHKRPFVGASGKVLRSLITDSAGLGPTDWFLTNVVKYRPPGNRTPEPAEIEASVPYLRAEYAAVGSPPVLVAVGGSARSALGPGLSGGVLALAGKPHPFPGGKTLWVMIHPSYGLRNPLARPTMEAHWTALGEWYRKEIG